MSGRQTQVRATEFIATNSPYELTQIAQTNTVEIGPVLEAVPYVLADGYTINLALIPGFMDFEGYGTDHSGNVIGWPQSAARFLIQPRVHTVNLWDGQTVMLGGFEERKPPATTTALATLEKEAPKKELLIFVTATIVDPAGNRVHTDAELPFAQKETPTQPGQMPHPMEQPSHVPPAVLTPDEIQRELHPAGLLPDAMPGNPQP